MINTKVILLNERFNSLENVQSNLLTLNNNKLVASISATEARELSTDDKTLYSNWMNCNLLDSHILEYDFHPEDEGTGNVRFLVKTAHVEYTKKQKRDNHGQLLEKYLRINVIDINVIFFEANNRIYAIICANDNHEKKVIDLVSSANIDNVNTTYEISANEFYWLFYRYSVGLSELNASLTISNITSFKGNIFDEHHVIEGNSDETSELIVTKAFVSTGNDFTKMKINLNSYGSNIVFLVDNISNLSIDAESTIILTEYPPEIVIPLYIVSIIIPIIHLNYIEDDFTEDAQVKQEFSKRVGLDVITKIIEYNNVELSDLMLLFETPQEEMVNFI